MVCIEPCSTRTMGNSALSGIVNVQALCAGGVVDIGWGMRPVVVRLRRRR
jgi:hypothetical protein